MAELSKYAKILEKICENEALGKKAVQKLMYLIERKGLNLDLNYKIHFFGPYSSHLDNVLQVLKSNEVIDIDTQGVTHTISIKEKQDEDILSDNENEIVSYIIEKFGQKSAFELEGITTVDYVARSFGETMISDEKIIEGVKRIKGTKFTEEQLYEYLSVLKEHGYLN